MVSDVSGCRPLLKTMCRQQLKRKRRFALILPSISGLNSLHQSSKINETSILNKKADVAAKSCNQFERRLLLAAVCVAMKARRITHSTCTATAIVDYPICRRSATAAHADHGPCRAPHVKFLRTTDALGAIAGLPRTPRLSPNRAAPCARIGLHLRRTANTIGYECLRSSSTTCVCVLLTVSYRFATPRWRRSAARTRC
jgi:hypothetical protein